MRIQFTSQLQRDMYAGWDSAASYVSSQRLTIKNIDKLVGMQTGSYSDCWLCTKLNDTSQAYEFTFRSNIGSTEMDVAIYKEKTQYNDNIVVGIRERIPQGVNSFQWSEESILDTPESTFIKPQKFLSWIDRQLDNKVIQTQRYLWKNTPFHKKVAIKFKDLLNNLK